MILGANSMVKSSLPKLMKYTFFYKKIIILPEPQFS